MIRMILSGCCGFMGRVVTEIADGDPDIQIVAGIDPRKDDTKPYPVYGTPAECQAEGDVLVDFSSAQALGGLLKYCVEKQVPAVLCSTGYSGSLWQGGCVKISQYVPGCKSSFEIAERGG